MDQNKNWVLYSFHYQWCQPGSHKNRLQYNFHYQYDASLLQTRYGKYTTFISNGATQAGTSKGWCTASIPNGATLDFTRWELITNENPPVLIQLAQSWHQKLPIVPEEDVHAPSPLHSFHNLFWQRNLYKHLYLMHNWLRVRVCAAINCCCCAPIGCGW